MSKQAHLYRLSTFSLLFVLIVCHAFALVSGLGIKYTIWFTLTDNHAKVTGIRNTRQGPKENSHAKVEVASNTHRSIQWRSTRADGSHQQNQVLPTTIYMHIRPVGALISISLLLRAPGYCAAGQCFLNNTIPKYGPGLMRFLP